jgi:hypothetical protein
MWWVPVLSFLLWFLPKCVFLLRAIDADDDDDSPIADWNVK